MELVNMAKRPYKKKDYIAMESEFNMAALDLERIDIILTRADESSLLCGEGRLNYLIHYFSALRAFYRYLRPLMPRGVYDNYDVYFNEMWRRIYVERKFNWNSFRQLENLHNFLLTSRQMMKLGLPASRRREISEKWLKPEYRGE